MPEENSPKDSPDPKVSPAYSGVGQLLEWMQEMYVPHMLMDSAANRNAVNSVFLAAFAAPVFVAVRWFSYSDDTLPSSILVSVSSYAVLAVAALVALRNVEKVKVKQEWSQISSLLFFVFLLSSCIFAAISYGFFSVFDDTLVNYSPLAYEWMTRALLAAFSAFLIVYLFSWRTHKVHKEIWEKIPNKRVWFCFYLVFVTISITLIASPFE